MENPQAIKALARLSAHWRIECRDAAGRVKWVEDYHNLITTEGLNLFVTRSFVTVPGDVSWFVGFKGAGAVAAGDTMASHAGWTEVTGYSQATRPAFTPGAVSSGAVSNAASLALFSVNATVTVAGMFLCTSSTKGGTTGSLFGVGDFSVSRSMIPGDSLSVQVNISAASA
jgi:hypothetical protein